MGEDTVNHAALAGGLEAKTSTTKTLRLHGWREAGEDRTALAEYGSDAGELRALCEKAGEKLLHPRLPYSAGQVVWAVRREMARTVGDMLSRRLRALMLDARAAIEMAPEVARIMALELGRDADWEKRQVEGFRELARGYLVG
jgi:glycerol-3-phosphate dehydrogenase